MCTVLADERPTARRRHGCNACGGTIGVGDVYERQRVVDGADIWTWKAHVLCSYIAHRLNREAGADDCDQPPEWGDVQEVLRGLLGGLLGAPAVAP